MDKPEVYGQRYVTFYKVPYTCGNAYPEADSLYGGVLARGEIVWAKDDFDLSRCRERASAFVEGLGIVFLDPKCLVRADVLEPLLKEAGWKGR